MAGQAVVLGVTRHARPDVEARERSVIADERATDAVRTRPLRVTCRAELDHVTACASRAVSGGLGTMIELAPRDAVIGRQHRLMALVARVARIARHLRVAGRASRRIALRRLGMVAAE